MKQINTNNKNIFGLLFLILTICGLSACNSEFDGDDSGPNTAPPIVSSVSEAREDTPVSQGVLEGTYIIRGENLSSLVSIEFNGVNAGFNAALLTDEIAFVKIPLDVPFIDQPNIMRIETLGGVVEVDFSLLTIEGFTEETVDGVKTVNIFGGDFTDVSTVTFVSGSEEMGNLQELDAPIISKSQTNVVAAVPGGVTQAFIFVESTRGATVQSASFGFNLPLYIDALNESWFTSEWGGTHDLSSTEQAIGDFSIKSIREAWSGLSFLPEAGSIQFSDFQAITVSIYGAGDIVSVNLAINDFDRQVQLTLSPGEWKKFTIPLSDFYPSGTEPDEIFRMDFQESSNTGLPQYIFYVDEFGLL